MAPDFKGQWEAETPRKVMKHFDGNGKNAVELRIRTDVSRTVSRGVINPEGPRFSEWRPNISEAVSDHVTTNTAFRCLLESFVKPNIWYWAEEGGSPLRLRQYTKLLEMTTAYLHFFGGEERFKPKPVTVLLTLTFIVVTVVFVSYYFISSWVNLTQSSACIKNTPADNALCIYAIMTVGYLTSSVCLLGLYTALITMFATILYGCDVACALTNNWLNRYEGLRRVPSEENQTSGEMESEYTLQQMAGVLERDAVERYLFLHQVLERSSRIWGFVLAGLLIVSSGLIVYAYIDFMYYYTVEGYIDTFSVTVMAVATCMIIFVLGGMMLANSANDRTTSGFTYSGIKDFAIIGGREAWIQFVEKSPVYWYIFGFAITRQWFFGFIGGTLVTIGGSLAFAFIGIEG